MELQERSNSEDYMKIETVSVAVTANSFDNLQLEKLQQQVNQQQEKIDFLLQKQSYSGNVDMLKATLVTFIFWMFLVCNACALPVLFTQVVLLSLGQRDKALSTGFYIVNLLGTAASIFGTGFAICHAPTPRLLRAYYVVCWLGCTMEAIWGYFAFGFIVVVFFSTSALTGLFLMVAGVSKVYMLITVCPVNDHMIELWFACWRVFAIVATPIVARFVQSGTASQVAFFIVTIFCMSMVMLCITSRALLAIYPSNSVSTLFLKLRLKTVIMLYGPIFGLLIVFAVLYIFEVAGLSFEVSDAFVISLLVVACCFITTWMMAGMLFGVKWKILEAFRPINSEEETKLHLAQQKGVELLGLSVVV